MDEHVDKEAMCVAADSKALQTHCKVCRRWAKVAHVPALAAMGLLVIPHPTYPYHARDLEHVLCFWGAFAFVHSLDHSYLDLPGALDYVTTNGPKGGRYNWPNLNEVWEVSRGEILFLGVQKWVARTRRVESRGFSLMHVDSSMTMCCFHHSCMCCRLPCSDPGKRCRASSPPQGISGQHLQAGGSLLHEFEAVAWQFCRAVKVCRSVE